jgi:hypothetical protein
LRGRYDVNLDRRCSGPKRSEGFRSSRLSAKALLPIS